MSQLGRLKQQISSLGEAASKTANGLQGFDSQFSSQIQNVSATMGGSAQSKDQQVIADLQSASKAVKDAVQALQKASRTAKDYGASL